MIHITDLSLLKITKVRDYAICFDYADKHYLLHGSSELGEGSGQELYERQLNENGYYTLTKLKTNWGLLTDYVGDDYIARQNGRTIVYSNVDKKYFAYKLTKRGFATGIMEQAVKDEKVQQLQGEIRYYEEKIRSLQAEISRLQWS